MIIIILFIITFLIILINLITIVFINKNKNNGLLKGIIASILILILTSFMLYLLYKSRQ